MARYVDFTKLQFPNTLWHLIIFAYFQYNPTKCNI